MAMDALLASYRHTTVQSVYPNTGLTNM